MNSHRSQYNFASDEIDLIALLERGLRFFRKFRWVFLSAASLGILAGFLAYSALSPIYGSRMILHSYVLTNQEHLQIIQNWSELLRKKEYPTLAATLNCREEILGSVKKLKAEEIQKVFTNQNPHGFIVGVNVTNNSVLGELQAGIVHGLENNQYVKKRLDARRENLRELINQTKTEIRKLDSTKSMVENIVAGRSRNVSSLIIDAASPNRLLIEMNEKLLSYQDELKFVSAVQVLQGFSTFKTPAGPKLVPWLVIGLAMFLSLAFLYAFIRSIGEKIRSRSIAARESTVKAA